MWILGHKGIKLNIQEDDILGKEEAHTPFYALVTFYELPRSDMKEELQRLELNQL